ncbi:MAG TPA: error-prone DNA polymerase [Bryobacteraceae bacterium]|nr:error-prone DNA polymerase [Bryobacteraceae bacterium]
MPYVELHARSAFSFLEGASVPEDLIDRCAQLEIPAVALLDRNSISGAVRFHQQAKKSGMRAIIGAEIAAPEGFRYALLAESRKGYQNLCRLITKIKLRTGHGEQENAVAHPEDLAEHAEGLVCLTGGDEGPLAFALDKDTEPRMLMSGPVPARAVQQDAALRQIRELTVIFGERNVFVELQRHYDRTEEYRNQAAIAIARKLRLPLLAANGVSHALEADRDLLDALTCVRHKTTIQDAGRLLARNSERHLKHAAQMEKLFADVPEAVANTRNLSARLRFTLCDLGYKFPEYPVPPGETMNSYLRKLSDAGARERYRPYHEKARRQIERELAMIEKLDLAGYFLIVWDIVRFAREQGLLVQGRGSAANSAVCYALQITAVDPVGMDLLFERFLSEERGEWPDIDLDLASGDERERAIQYVYERYGKLGAAMTANVITYRGRSAARDIGKVLGFETATLDRLSKVVPYWGFQDKRDTAERQFTQAGVDLEQPLVQKFLSLYERVKDLPRHLGQHSGGMVICRGQLDSIVPLQPATMPGRFVVQWDKEDCADMGIVKVDLLGLGMMAVIKESLGLIREHYGEEVDLAHLPAGDPQVYAALQKADTVGMFQVESRAQMSFLPGMRPDKFYDLVVQVAIIRPGPIVGKMLHPYLRRRQGLEPVTYPHPGLEPVLARTLGVPLFQEQLLRMAMIVAGFTGGQAEELRRAMGFKRSEKRMQEIEARLREGMTRNAIAAEVQDLIVRSIGSFAAYGFPESHAASFALLAYASAYLKCHYLAVFTAAILNNQPMGFYHPATLVKDAQRHSLHFKPVDVARSEWACTLEKDEGSGDRGQGSGKNATPDACPLTSDPWTVRLGFNYLKGLGRETAARIIEARSHGAFTSIRDLVRRVPEIRKEELDSLAEAGALNFIEKGDSLLCAQQPTVGSRPESLCGQSGLSLFSAHLPFSIHRRDALWRSELAMRPVGELLEPAEKGDRLLCPDTHNKEIPNTSGSGQSGLSPFSTDDEPSPLVPMNPIERLAADYRITGLTIGAHPMRMHRDRMNRLGVIPAADLAHVPDGRRVRIAGAVICRQRPGTANGFVFLSIEDETGISNAIVLPDLFEARKLTIVEEPFLLVDGILQNQRGSASVKASCVEGLRLDAASAGSHDFH